MKITTIKYFLEKCSYQLAKKQSFFHSIIMLRLGETKQQKKHSMLQNKPNNYKL